MKSDRHFHNQHVLITGGVSGLGLGAARRFARLGARITLLDVNAAAAPAAMQGLCELGAGVVEFEAVDLVQPAEILKFAQGLTRRGLPVDVLINNAGIYPPSQRSLTPEGQELTFAIAVMGHFRLTHALLPLLKAARAARVITVSSLVQRQAQLDVEDLSLAQHYHPFRAYQQAKLACLMFALELQRRLSAAGSSVSSYAVHPGVVRTQLGRNRRISAQDSLWQKFSSRALAFGLGSTGQTPENGAEALVMAAGAAYFPAGSFIGPTGPLETFGQPGLLKPGRAASNPELAKALWQRLATLTGLDYSW